MNQLSCTYRAVVIHVLKKYSSTGLLQDGLLDVVVLFSEPVNLCLYSTNTTNSRLVWEQLLPYLPADNCHGPGCSRSRRVMGSYGRSTGIEDLVDTSREHGRSAVSMETMDSYGLTCKGGPSTATKRTKLKEHADGYHSGARETRAKGTVTDQRRRSSVEGVDTRS
ncbi:hypothetical protein NDA12_004540 [Ustilago hordei]|nr:hypothetical protein NDA12_004540 [Ustilago hordei]KAJ1571505.1 hypothetical protein NDA15_004247 [Ustilago hordei]